MCSFHKNSKDYVQNIGVEMSAALFISKVTHSVGARRNYNNIDLW